MNTIHGLARATLAAVMMTTPALAIDIDLREAGAPDRAAATAFAPSRFAGMEPGEPVTIRALPVGDAIVDLELEPFSVWTDDAVFMIDDTEHARPEITLLRGTVSGDDESLVVVGIGSHATNGFIKTGGKVFSISTGRAGFAPTNPSDLLITDMESMDLGSNTPVCGVDMSNLTEFAPLGLSNASDAQVATRGTPPCRVVRIAIDTDWLWLSERFGGNTQAGAEYALLLMAGISEIYQRDVNVRLAVPFLRVFSGNTDPYEDTNDPDPLIQLRDHWRSAMQHIDRDLAHLFTGVNTSYGGVAYLGALCSDQWGYGVSSYHGGSFPYPLLDNNGGNWDLVVTAHELGHNFGTGHTHDSYTPTIDDCGNGDCSQPRDKTIMSYCHTCSGGISNIDLRFDARVRDRIAQYLADDAPCDLTPDVGAENDSARTFPGEPVDIFVLANDSGPACAPVGLASVVSPTPGGGTAEIAGWDNVTGDPTGRFIRYTPSEDQSGTDTISYTNTAGQSATVDIELLEYREADTIASIQPGLTGAWYDIGANNAVVPDFEGREPVQSGVVANLNYESTNGAVAGGPLSDNVGAVFEGYIRALRRGLYTFQLESDDGSLLYVGDELLVNNDGLHGMQVAGGSVGLDQGFHAIRIEFFESGGAAGLIFRWSGPSGDGVVPASALRHNDPQPCLADLAPPFGVLDLSDISIFVLGFQLQSPDVDFAPPEGVLDLSDITAFVDSFNSGCP